MDIYAEFNSLRYLIKKLNPSLEVNSISKIPESSFFSVELNNGQKIYTDEAGNHFLTGELFKIDENRIINLTKVELLTRLKPKDLVVFRPDGHVKRILTIFSDIDCSYCRKLHESIYKLTSAGIEVRYAAFPRAGEGSDSFIKYVSVLCSSDRLEAMNRAKQGKKISDNSCKTNISEQFLLGQLLGVRGTPTMFLENGEAIYGYMPINDLLARIK